MFLRLSSWSNLTALAVIRVGTFHWRVEEKLSKQAWSVCVLYVHKYVCMCVCVCMCGLVVYLLSICCWLSVWQRGQFSLCIWQRRTCIQTAQDVGILLSSSRYGVNILARCVCTRDTYCFLVRDFRIKLRDRVCGCQRCCTWNMSFCLCGCSPLLVWKTGGIFFLPKTLQTSRVLSALRGSWSHL